MLSQARAQHIYFAHTLVPELFFSNPDGLLRMLRGGAEHYLSFLWGRAAEAEGPALGSSVHPPTSQMLEFRTGYRIGVVLMPAPEAPGEAAYLGLITRKAQISLRGVGRFAPRYVLLVLDDSTGSSRGPWTYQERSRADRDRSWPGPPTLPSPTHFIGGVRDLVAT